MIFRWTKRAADGSRMLSYCAMEAILLLFTLALTYLGTGLANNTIQEAKTMAEKPFGLSEPEYWSNPQKNLMVLARKIIRSRVEGMVIDCPDRVVISERQTLPLLCYYSGPIEVLHVVSFEEHAVVTAVNSEEDVVYAALAAVRTGVPKPVGEPAPTPGFTGEYHFVDLRARMGIPWRPGRYLITAFLRDKISNRVFVDLAASPTTYDDPEVKKFLEQQRLKRLPRPVSPSGSPAVIYGKINKSLPVPQKPGIQLQADRVVVGKPEEKGLLRGSFRLPVRGTDVLRRLSQKDAKGSPMVTAIAGITLLIIGSEDSGPVAFPMVAPSYEDIAGGPESPIATGYFQIDMMKIGLLPPRPQTFFIYAFAGVEMAGPALLAVVSPESLPRER